MADSASESDSSSIDGGPIMMPPSPVTREQLHKRNESLQQQNRVLKVELETFKLRVKALQEENRCLRQASVNIQAKAEQEEEYISNTLLKKIQALKKEKETLAHHYEQEEECLTNDLSRKLNQLRAEKCKLEQTLEQEQECLVNKLMRKIEKLEAETMAKQANLEQLRREKVELENTLEQEQEALVNRLWKRMDKLEAEKRSLQSKIDNPGGVGSVPGSQAESPMTPMTPHGRGSLTACLGHPHEDGDKDGNETRNPSIINSRHHHPNSDVITLSGNIQILRNEVDRLKAQLNNAQQQHSDKMAQYVMEERQIRDENLRLQRRLQLEVERRESLCRHLSESESSLEMEDERHFHESLVSGNLSLGQLSGMNNSGVPSLPIRPRPGSSPGPFLPSPGSGSRPMSPGMGLQLSCGSASREVMSPPSPVSRCHLCNGHGWIVPGASHGSGGPLVVTTSTGPFSHHSTVSSSPPIRHSNSKERFARPAAPPPNDRGQEPRTPGDSTMTSPAPSPAPLEVVMSPAAAPSPSPMDTSKN